jgi:hypothetical protein
MSAWLRHLRETLISFWAFVVSLFSKLRAPIQKYWDAIRPQDNTNDERTNPQNKDLHSIPPKTNPPPAPPYKKNSCKKCRKCLDVARFVIELLALIGLAIYAGLTWKIWREMQRQTALQMEISRPRMVPSDVTGVYYDGHEMYIRVRVQNNGNVDAFSVSIAAKFGFRPSDPTPMERRFSFADFSLTSPPALPPFVSTQVTALVESPHQVISTEDYAAGKSQKFYVWGEIHFQDPSQVQQTPFPFCRYVSGDALRTPAPGYVVYGQPWTVCTPQTNANPQ